MINTENYKKLLEQERAQLLLDLKGIDAIDTEFEAGQSDIATRDEKFEEDTSLKEELSLELDIVNKALKRIQDGTFGKCITCGELIEEDRLQANPSAPTCTLHMGA